MKITPLHIYAVVTILIIGCITATALWVEPIMPSFTLGGHIGATGALIGACAFFIALFTFD